MSSRNESKFEATENPGEAALDISGREFVGQLSDNYNRHSGTCLLCTEDENLIIDSISSTNKLLKKKSGSSFHYVKMIEEFQHYIDMVKDIVRPGCSSETLNLALSSMSALVETLDAISSKQYRHASL